MITHNQRQTGFSLLEVVVAFAIAAIALSITGQIFGQGTRNLALTRDYSQALLLADGLFAEYGRPLAAESQTYSDSRGEFEWRVSLHPYIDPIAEQEAFDEELAGDLQLMQINVDVDWKRYGKSRSLSLSSLRTVAKDNAARAL